MIISANRDMLTFLLAAAVRGALSTIYYGTMSTNGILTSTGVVSTASLTVPVKRAGKYWLMAGKLEQAWSIEVEVKRGNDRFETMCRTNVGPGQGAAICHIGLLGKGSWLLRVTLWDAGGTALPENRRSGHLTIE
jgi:hypothetical protein